MNIKKGQNSMILINQLNEGLLSYTKKEEKIKVKKNKKNYFITMLSNFLADESFRKKLIHFKRIN